MTTLGERTIAAVEAERDSWKRLAQEAIADVVAQRDWAELLERAWDDAADRYHDHCAHVEAERTHYGRAIDRALRELERDDHAAAERTLRFAMETTP